MPDSSQMPAATRHTVTALFDSRPEAEKAKADLLAAGFSETTISFAEGSEAMALAKPKREENVLTALMNIFIFMPQDDRSSVEEALRRGATALTIKTLPEDYERAIDILDRDGAIDLDERQVSWQSEGWTAPTGRDSTAARPGFEAHEAHDPLTNPAANPDLRERIGVGTASMTAGMDASPAHAGGDSSFAAAARRDQQHGRRRVRGYIAGTDGTHSGEIVPNETGSVRGRDVMKPGIDPQI